MPELPDVTVYIEALRARVIGARLERVQARGPSLLRSVDSPIDATEGRTVESVDRLGKRIIIGLGGQHFLVIHLMIAGRLRWQETVGGRRQAAGLEHADRERSHTGFLKDRAGTL